MKERRRPNVGMNHESGKSERSRRRGNPRKERVLLSATAIANSHDQKRCTLSNSTRRAIHVLELADSFAQKIHTKCRKQRLFVHFFSSSPSVRRMFPFPHYLTLLLLLLTDCVSSSPSSTSDHSLVHLFRQQKRTQARKLPQKLPEVSVKAGSVIFSAQKPRLGSTYQARDYGTQKRSASHMPSSAINVCQSISDWFPKASMTTSFFRAVHHVIFPGGCLWS